MEMRDSLSHHWDQSIPFPSSPTPLPALSTLLTLLACIAIAATLVFAPRLSAAPQEPSKTNNTEDEQPAAHPAASLDVKETISEIRRLRQAKEFASAANLLRKLDGFVTEHHPGIIQLAADYVLLARGGQGDLDQQDIDELFAAAYDWLYRDDAPPIELRQRIVLATAIATHDAAGGQIKLAADKLLEICEHFLSAAADSRETITPEILLPAQSLAMRTAWSAMSSGLAEDAERLYQTLLETHADERIDETLKLSPSHLALCRLGLGWSIALQPSRNTDAAEKLTQFLDQHDDHTDAPKASALRVRCLIDQTNTEQAVDEQRRSSIEWHFQRYPDSDEAPTLALEILRSSDAIELPLKEWLIANIDSTNWPNELRSRVIVSFGNELPPADFDQLVTRLTSLDRGGSWTAQTLEECDRNDQSAISELIAAAVIGGRIDEATERSVEAAARWAGRTERWSMLQLAAEEVDLDTDPEKRTIHVDRLFAEAIFRSGRKEKALQFWNHVVDRRGADDFTTLLRCAECAVQVDEIAKAERRLGRVRELIDQDESLSAQQKPLVDLLEADLAIRKLEFDRARTQLESVVRSAESSAMLRARAQWMIGETYLLQENYGDAIDAYRLVENLDPGGPYAAAALVQAGKAFEQLGRTRQASVCYGSLLERFADSSYANEARHRLSALPDQTTPSTRR